MRTSRKTVDPNDVFASERLRDQRTTEKKRQGGLREAKNFLEKLSRFRKRFFTQSPRQRIGITKGGYVKLLLAEGRKTTTKNKNRHCQTCSACVPAKQKRAIQGANNCEGDIWKKLN